jgi:hypothetical protein
MSAADGPALVTIAAGAWCDPVTGLCSEGSDDEGPGEEVTAEARGLTPPSR